MLDVQFDRRLTVLQYMQLDFSTLIWVSRAKSVVLRTWAWQSDGKFPIKVFIIRSRAWEEAIHDVNTTATPLVLVYPHTVH